MIFRSAQVDMDRAGGRRNGRFGRTPHQNIQTHQWRVTLGYRPLKFSSFAKLRFHLWVDSGAFCACRVSGPRGDFAPTQSTLPKLSIT